MHDWEYRVWTDPCRPGRARAGGRMLAVLMVCVAALWPARSAVAHPKPGAHADVRINIEDDGVRVDVLMNILFADQLVNTPRKARDAIAVDEQEPLRRDLAEYFGAARGGAVTALIGKPNRVSIDGVDVAPTIKELTIVYPAPETRPGFVQNPALLLPQIHVVAEYSAKTPPKTVALVWGTYPRDFLAQGDRDLAPISDIEAVLTSGGELALITFRHLEPEYVWHGARDRSARFREVPRVAQAAATRIPAVSLGLIGLGAAGLIVEIARRRRVSWRSASIAVGSVGIAAILWQPLRVSWVWSGRSAARAPSGEAALAIFEPLHANIYRAFDYTRESDIYDALARSVDGPLLDRVYDDIYRSLVMQEEGGALSRIRAVIPLSSEVRSGGEAAREDGAFCVVARWQVEGVVYHWGHSHARTNQHSAEYTIAPRVGGWRIVACTALEQFRVQSPEQAGSPASVNAPPPSPAPNSAPTAAPSLWRPNR